MVTATLMRPSKVSTPPKPQFTNRICPRCGGRLFFGSEFQGVRLRYFLECINCARTFDDQGRLASYYAGEQRVRVVW